MPRAFDASSLAGVEAQPADLPQPAVHDVSRAVPLFTATIFVGSALLFLVQPMFAKLALPRLGGSPSVWNTCVLFFQATLLLGYLYAHFSTRWFGVRRQIYGHIILLLAPAALLPLTAGDGQPTTTDNPIGWLLWTMTVTVGLPFFVVSTSAPLLQRWFATLPLASARDPYFLYAASNLGSMLALLGYPFVLEPLIGTRDLTWLWTAGYAVFVLLTAACAMTVRTLAAETDAGETTTRQVEDVPLSARKRLEWVFLAFVPSSLMLGVTTHISTDIAAVPLLWVLPLAIYLATFALSFSARERLPHRHLVNVLPTLAFVSLLTMLGNAQRWWIIPVHLITFFAVAMVCHRELALRRPDVRHLTEFYIWMSVGGVIGGVFNGLVAPLMFTRIVEYPLVLAIASQVRRSVQRPSPPPGLLLTMPIFAALAAAVWASGITLPGVEVRYVIIGSGFLVTLGYMFAYRLQPVAAMALLLAGVIAFDRPTNEGTVLFEDRSFFGVHRVLDAPDHRYHLLQHGSTSHGHQRMPAGTSCNPSAYYHPLNPIGQLFGAGAGRFKHVALIGLGTGSLACYAEAGQRWTFYEIDPLVEQIARNSQYFSFLQNSPGEINVVLGDGRLSIQDAPAGSYDLLVLDAFSSDGIPVHLLTREAVQLYLSRLKADGVIAVHISNRFLDLEPVLGAVAQEEGLAGLANADLRIPKEMQDAGRFASHWVILARKGHAMEGLGSRPGWRPLAVRGDVRPWSDDYSNVFRVLRTN